MQVMNLQYPIAAVFCAPKNCAGVLVDVDVANAMGLA